MRIIVVGGGPVGLFASVLAAHRGHSVTVLERRRGDGDKACGEGLMPSAVAALEHVGVRPRGRAFGGIRYLDADGRSQVRADLVSGCGLGVRRTELVRALRQAVAEAAVETVAASVVAVDHGDGTVSVSDGGDHRWHGDLVLGCDGLGSSVRRLVGVEREASGRRRYGLVGHFATAPWTSDVEVYWGDRGEAYVTPVDDALVGVAFLGDRGSSFCARLDAMPALRRQLRGAEPAGSVLGAGPMRRRARTPVRGRVALVGDAAGYVDALTGEGLAIGFASAEAVLAAAEQGDLAQYEAQWRRLVRRPTLLTEALVRATGPSSVRASLVPMAARAPAVFRRLVAVLG